MVFSPFQMGLKDLIQRDSFYAPEVEIFQAVVEWVRANQSDSIDTNSVYSSQDGSEDSAESALLTEASSAVLSAVRLPLMNLMDLLTVVRPTNLIPPDTILDAIAARNQGRDTELRYRGCLSKYKKSRELSILLLSDNCSNFFLCPC